MPQETKSVPYDPDQADVATGTVHENLEGWIPPLATDDEVRTALEKAFDYRGDVTVTLKGGGKIEGYCFDRRPGPTLAGAPCHPDNQPVPGPEGLVPRNWQRVLMSRADD